MSAPNLDYGVVRQRRGRGYVLAVTVTERQQAISLLAEIIGARIGVLEYVLPSRVVSGDAAAYGPAAKLLVDNLASSDADTVASTADTIKLLAHPSGPPPRAWFTDNPLGRLVLLATGGDAGGCVTKVEAAAMLGVSRQAVDKAVAAGRLERGDTGITVESVLTLRAARQG